MVLLFEQETPIKPFCTVVQAGAKTKEMARTCVKKSPMISMMALVQKANQMPSARTIAPNDFSNLAGHLVQIGAVARVSCGLLNAVLGE